MLRGTRAKCGAAGTDRPRSIVPLPAIVAGERDMLPAQRCDMTGNVVRRSHIGQCPFEIAGVPKDNRGDQKVEAGGAVGLVLEPAIAQLAELVEEQCARKRVARFPLVQPCLGASAQIDILQPVEHEDRAFKPPDLAQRQRQAILPRIGREPAQHCRGRDGSGSDRRGEPQQFVPMRGCVVVCDRIADHAGEQRPCLLTGQQMQAALLYITQAWREAVAEERHQPEYMVGRAACVGVMLLDRQPGLVVQQTVEDIGGLARGRGDHARAERVILVRDMRIEGHAGFVAFARVDVADGGTTPTCMELLPVARRADAAAPQSRKRHHTVRVDQSSQRLAIGSLADVPVMQMGELAQARAPATVRHVGQTEINAVGEDHGQQCVAIVGRTA